MMQKEKIRLGQIQVSHFFFESDCLGDCYYLLIGGLRPIFFAYNKGNIFIGREG